MNDYLDEIEKQLVELTERGPHRRVSVRRSEALAILAAVAVAAAVVAIVVLNVGTATPRRASAIGASGQAASTPGATVTTAPGPSLSSSASTPALTQLPTSFAPQSFTAISELTWWLLGSQPCSSGACPAILRTTDGGPTFKAIQAPPGPLATSVSGNVGYSQIRFADANNGFAYGPDLYVTHDGGASWKPVAVGGRVGDLEISAGEAYAIVTDGAGTSGHLMRSPVDQDQWAVVPAAGAVSGGLWVLGHEVIVQSGSDGPRPEVLVSQNGGEGFSRQPAPSPGLPCAFEAQSAQVIWAHCVTGTESGIWRSSDYITGFTPVHGAGLAPLPNSAAFGAASNTTAVVGDRQLYRTGDAGQTWTAVGPSGIARWTYIGFSDATHGVALGYAGSIAPQNEQLFYTTDAGQSYHLVPLP